MQNLFRQYAAGRLRRYIVAAIPVAFLAAALVGAAMERSVIRWLYGRPLETLLATWGISLILMQAVRSLFGAQNVPVENPAWLSGGVQVLPQPDAALQPHRDPGLRRAGAGGHGAADRAARGSACSCAA